VLNWDHGSMSTVSDTHSHPLPSLITIYTEAKINHKMHPRLALESVSRGSWHCLGQHFKKVAQRNAKLPGTGILRPARILVPIYLGLGVYGHYWGEGVIGSMLSKRLHNVDTNSQTNKYKPCMPNIPVD
jgi:hypothetical protein